MQRPISTKPRVIKDFEKLDEIIQEQIKLAYPEGFLSHLIKYQNKEGKMVSALPFETDEKSYLVRMSRQEAEILIEEDDDYDEDGNLKNRVKDEYEEKYSELDYMSDYLQEEGNEEEEDDE